MGLVGLDDLGQLVGFLAHKQQNEAITLFDNVLSQGVSVEQFITDLAEYFRNLLLIKNGIEKESLLGAPVSHFNGDVLTILSIEQLEAGLDRLFDLYRNIKFSVNPRFEVELMLSRLSSLANYISPAAIVTQINELKDSLTASNAHPDDEDDQKKN
jgi:DNA polymerase-3 subunit gamma/tau